MTTITEDEISILVKHGFTVEEAIEIIKDMEE